MVITCISVRPWGLRLAKVKLNKAYFTTGNVEVPASKKKKKKKKAVPKLAPLSLDSLEISVYDSTSCSVHVHV